MTPFLKQFAIDIYEKHKDDFAEICIVMPARRAQKYFIHYLSEHTKKTILLPEIFTIDEFVCNLTSFKTIDKTELLLLLYNYHNQNYKDENSDFKHFLGWASLFLSDINEIDMQLANAKSIFTSLAEIKELSYYDIPENERTAMQINHLQFFEQLYQNYLFLNQNLSEKSIGYQGLIYRKASEDVNLINETSKWKKIIFCGFNALTKSETKIIKQLILDKKAETYWDADILFFEDEVRDAGLFLRNSKKDFSLNDDFPYLSNYFEQEPKNIQIIGTPNAISQVKLVGEMMSDYQSNKTNSNESFVIVPADESLLPALINTINPNDINITMGMPLNMSIVYKLYSLIFGMHINIERSINQHNRKDRHLYYKDVIGIFSHPSFSKLASKYNSSLIDATHHLKLQNIVYCSTNTISKLNGISEDFIKIIAPVFDKCENYSLFVKELRNLNNLLNNNLFFSKSSLNEVFTKSALNYFDEVFDFLETLCQNYPIDQNAEFIFNLFNSKVSEYSISYIGDAINGPQLMGLLETRLLDFDNVIILSVNEETLPAGKTTNSLLPFDLRRYFNLHSHIHKDAVYSYHFFRLLQRAKNATIIYNADLKEGKSEKSRFINQLIFDIAPKLPSLKIQESILNISPNITPTKKISISKEGTVIDTMSSLKALSPSALGIYIQCPLKFYFSNVAKIQELEEITESTDDKMLGNIIHGVLDKIYKQFPIGQNIHENDLKNINDAFVIEKIEEEYENLRDFNIPKEDLKFGKNRLAFEVIKNYIINFINDEINEVKTNCIIPIAFEQKIEIEVPVLSNILNNIRLKGIIDRIDLHNETLRIIDYKTGKVDKNDLKFIEFPQLFSNPKLAKSLQLLCYTLLYSKQINMSKESTIQPMIVAFKNKDTYFEIDFNESNQINKEMIDEFEEHLISFLSDIFDTSIPFIQTTDEKQCKLCSFNTICNLNSLIDTEE